MDGRGGARAAGRGPRHQHRDATVSTSRYATPAAFRRAITDRLKTLAGEGRWSYQQLQRQLAYDRLLERLYLIDDGWIVKGATALLARDLGVRGSLDMDIYRDVARSVAEQDLRRAATLDLDDWFRFEVGAATTINLTVLRLPITAMVGATIWVQFHVDLVGTDLTMTGQPDDVPPLARGVIPDITQRGYRAYPLVDHIADKVAATYDKYGQGRLPSTRYRDLVDLVAIISGASVAADAQRLAIESEFARRGLELPTAFDVPDRRLWQAGYAAEARKSLLTGTAALDAALDIVRPFLDPVLTGLAVGRWDPLTRLWVPAERASRGRDQ
jgi:hypothetical protein